MNQLTASTRLAARVAKAFGLDPASLAAPRRRGSHGTRLQADARAAACFTLKHRHALTTEQIGVVVGLSRSSVEQALKRAPQRFKCEQLWAFVEGRKRLFPVQLKTGLAPVGKADRDSLR